MATIKHDLINSPLVNISSRPANERAIWKLLADSSVFYFWEASLLGGASKLRTATFHLQCSREREHRAAACAEGLRNAHAAGPLSSVRHVRATSPSFLVLTRWVSTVGQHSLAACGAHKTLGALLCAADGGLGRSMGQLVFGRAP